MRTVEDHRAALLALVAPLALLWPRAVVVLVLLDVLWVVAFVVDVWRLAGLTDGYAVHAADLHGPLPVRLPVIADIPAGDPRALHVPRGSAARIMTGAPLPAEADAVVPVEDTDAGVSVVEIRARVAPGRHVRRRGEDVRAGEPVVATDTVLTPGALALVAAANVTSGRAHPRPRVALFSTGDELIPLGDEPAPGQIVDSNQLMLAELVRAAGADLAHAGHLPDDAEAVRALLTDPPGAPDLVLTSGGVSMGAHDTVKEVLTAAGTVEFVKVAMRPGMPQGAGTLGPRGIPVVTLPGNPVSSLVSFQVFVVPLLRRLDFFFVPPHLSFAVEDAQYLVTFAVMLAVALITGQMAARLNTQAEEVRQREARTRALYDMARDLAGVLAPAQVAEILRTFLRGAMKADACLFLPDADGHLQAMETDSITPPDSTLPRRAFQREEPLELLGATGRGEAVLYLPLKAPMRTRGVLAILPSQKRFLFLPEQTRLLETLASQIALALERVHYVEVAQDALIKMESERLRNGLLSALSHDLRTPLTVLAGLADSLPLAGPPLPQAQAEIAQAIRAESLRTSLLVSNLLDMARLQQGSLRLKREWQPLDEVVGAALQSLAGQLVRHRIQVDLPADLPLLEIDAVLMERVFCNLLENAAKYTPPAAGSKLPPGTRAIRWPSPWRTTALACRLVRRRHCSRNSPVARTSPPWRGSAWGWPSCAPSSKPTKAGYRPRTGLKAAPASS